MYNSYFEEKIRQRGFEYFKKQKVCNIIENDNKITATVIGSQAYDVEVLFNKDNDKIIESAKCECPYCTDKYHYCKHIYATILSVKYDEKLDREENLKEQREKQKALFDLKMKNEKELKKCKKLLMKIKSHLFFDRLYISKDTYKRCLDYSKNKQKVFNTILKQERKIGEDIFYYYARSKSIEQLYNSLIKNLDELEEIITTGKKQTRAYTKNNHEKTVSILQKISSLIPDEDDDEVKELKVGDRVYIKPYQEEGIVKEVWNDDEYSVEFESEDGNYDDEEMFHISDLKKI